MRKKVAGGNRMEVFLVTGSKNRVLCNNVDRRRRWVWKQKTLTPQVKECLSPHKVLSLWWDMKDVFIPLSTYKTKPPDNKGDLLQVAGTALIRARRKMPIFDFKNKAVLPSGQRSATKARMALQRLEESE
ncbi:hypothetical protein AVEN_223161-1 [Araneus ventricosus]|uniref:Uncharacterized protein n=1 Tax=Araneus ventricosus TaxID=182803 RepID=A0A4Y2FRC2_ARAVE|nr:hypothetical protein AVEN_223161-1 [Araneus ventricosus]